MLTLASDNLITLSDLADQYGTTIADATVSVTIETLAGDEIASGTLIAAGGGTYNLVITAAALSDLVESQRYRLILTATKSGQTLVKRWEETAKYQGQGA